MSGVGLAPEILQKMYLPNSQEGRVSTDVSGWVRRYGRGSLSKFSSNCFTSLGGGGKEMIVN